MLYNRDRFFTLLFYLGSYCLLILAHGYTFGANDQMDFMPYARHLQDPSLYSHDFYIECIGARFNERWLLAHIVSTIPHPIWPAAFLLIHFIFTILLFAGLKKWAALFIKEDWLQWGCLFTVLILLYHRNLGGNELYYNMVCASLIAKAIAVWALYYSYRSSWVIAALLTILCTYIHPIVGVHALIFSFVLMLTKNKLKYILFSFVGVCPYLFYLFKDLNHSIPPQDFVSIMHLRNAHHFFSGDFGYLNYIILIPIFLWATTIWYRLDKRIFNLIIMILSGCIVYTFMMSIAPQYAIQTQWFKSTIWLKFFSVIGMVYAIQSYPIVRLKISFIGIFAIFLTIKIYRITNHFSSDYQLPWSTYSDEVKLAIQAKTQSTADDIFLVPADFTAFKYYSERPTYVDWKAIPHNGQCLEEWKDRIHLSYNIVDFPKNSLDKIYKASRLHLSHLTDIEKSTLKAQGVVFIIYENDQDKYLIEKL